MFLLLPYSLWLATAFAAISSTTVSPPLPGYTSTREIHIDASNVTGQLKNFQGTNSAEDSFIGQENGCGSGGNDCIYDLDPAIAALWPEYGVQNVLIYTFPDVFMGFGKNGTAGDAMRNENYNWTLADKYIRFVLSGSATVSINFVHSNGMNPTVSSPEKLGQIGYMIVDRYVNGAHNSGFKTSIELFDFYAESDLMNSPTALQDYEKSFSYFAGFSKGVVNASATTGVGAWGGNRIPQPNTNYSLYDPYVAKFYKDCAEQNIPIKAATYHFTNTQFSWDPYDVKVITDNFRRDVLTPAGLPNLPIYITEYEPNPNGVLPTSAATLKDYNDPAFFSAFMLGISMYAQDSTLSGAFAWTGFGYGGYGAGHAWFHSWFDGDGPVTNTSFPTASNGTTLRPRNIASAWKLQGLLVQRTPSRLAVSLPNSNIGDGFAVLAGRDVHGGRVQIMLNNYQLNYDIPREIAAELVPTFNTSTTAYPLIQDSGLFNGEQGCFNNNNPQFGLPICQTYIQAKIRDNAADSYHLVLNNLPWSNTTKYRLNIQRVGEGSTYQVYQNMTGMGNTVDLGVPFGKNAQDLVTVEWID